MFGATNPAIREAVEREEYLLEAFASDTQPLEPSAARADYEPTVAELEQLDRQYRVYLRLHLFDAHE